MPHILLLGGHGKISQFMTPLFLQRAWDVTSVIRTAEQTPAIKGLAPTGCKGKLGVLVRSLDEIQSDAAAESVLREVKPDWIVWSAGAGGKGGASMTKAVDEVACKRFVSAAYRSPGVSKFLLVSYDGSRRARPSWWDDEHWRESRRVNEEVLSAYSQAKIAADEYLTSALLAARDGKRPNGGGHFAAIDLRPGTLTDDPAGQIQLGKTTKRGKVSRESVAQVAAALLESSYKGGWIDLLDGEEDLQFAVDRVSESGWDSVQGEDLDRIRSLIDQD